jgi:phenylacetic acid degradation protein PaaD
MAGDAAGRALGIELVEAGPPGHAVLRMTVRPDMLQGLGICHGGILFTLCDAAFAVACNNHLDGPTVGAAADITWVAPAYGGDVLVATAHQHTRYGRNGITDVTVRREHDAVLVARFRGRSLVLPTPAAGARTTTTTTTTTGTGTGTGADQAAGSLDAELERQEW